jgi:DNA-binding transcriptional MerR regulator
LKKEYQPRTIPEKLFFSIGEVSEITNLPPSVLRFWEKQFKQLSPRKSRGGHRRYQKKDLELILQIKDLLYNRKFTIQGANKKISDLHKEREIDPDLLKKELQELLNILD